MGWLADAYMRLRLRLLAAVLLSITLAACGRPPTERANVATDLANAAYLAPASGRIDMASIATFDWETMHVFETCLDQDVIDRSLGFHFDTSSLRNGEYCNDIEVGRPLVVFSTKQAVDGWVVLNADRTKAVFFDTGPDGILIVSRASGTFVVRIGPGPSERDLAPAP